MTWFVAVFLASLSLTDAFSLQKYSRNSIVQYHNADSVSSLQSVPFKSDHITDTLFAATIAAQKKLCLLLVGSLLFAGNVPTADAIDPSSLKQYTITPGAGIDPAQLKKFTDVQETLDAADIEYTMLKSGTSYREFREGMSSVIEVVGPSFYSVTTSIKERRSE